MEWFVGIESFWNEYYPIVLTVGGSIVAVIAGLVLVYTQAQTIIKPILDWIKGLKDKEEQDIIKNDISTQLQSITLDTQITDLKAKIENPTVSDTLKQSYISQLVLLEVIKAKLEVGIVTLEDTTSKY